VLQINFQWVKVPSRGVTTRSVASRKVANREVRTEGSEPAKFGTDEQEVHKRSRYRICKVLKTKPTKSMIGIDVSGIG